MAAEKVVDSRFRTYNPQFYHKFEWILEKFSKIKLNTDLTSPKFKTKDGSIWYVSYVKMIISGYEQSVFSFYNSLVTRDYFSIKVHLGNRDGTLFSPTVSAYNKENSISFSFHHRKIVDGYYQNLNLPDDNMVLTCEMSWNKVSLETQGYNSSILNSSSKVRLKTLSCDLKTIYENSAGSDVTLMVQGTNILTHKTILIARSEVFAKMITNDMKEKTEGVIEIKDFEPVVIKLLLQYLYTGECADCDIETAQALYRAADKYSVLELKQMVIEMLLSKISTENAMSTLALADLHDDKDFKNEVTAFVKYHLAEIQNIENVWNIFENSFSDEHCSALLKNLCFKKNE